MVPAQRPGPAAGVSEMARIASAATETVLGLLRASEGLSAAIAEVGFQEEVALEEVGESQMLAGNVPLELADRSCLARFPLLHVYCDRVRNLQREKFRAFSGTARVNIELRVSDERMERLERKLQLYVDAVTAVLERNRGDWGQGMSYAGGYEIQFGAVKSGGKNYIQAAKLALEVDVSQN